jgi:hypothetical protein
LDANTAISEFTWTNGNKKKKASVAALKLVVPKSEGGLGFPHLATMSSALKTSLLFKILPSASPISTYIHSFPIPSNTRPEKAFMHIKWPWLASAVKGWSLLPLKSYGLSINSVGSLLTSIDIVDFPDSCPPLSYIYQQLLSKVSLPTLNTLPHVLSVPLEENERQVVQSTHLRNKILSFH